VRLFTALWVPPAAAAELRSLITTVPPGWRAVDPDSWHLTLAFHGEAEPAPLAAALDLAARDTAAPRLRLHGAGSFRGVRWAGVQAQPAEALARLVGAAGGDPDSFVPHVTLLRRRGGTRPSARTEPAAHTLPWRALRGTWWQPTDVLVVQSDRQPDGPRYRVVHRVRLRPG
jgi:RNA 2',3'-cyclic 3'-phosphodiesterase